MKKLLVLATLSLMSVSSFASMHCSIATDTNGDGNFDNNIALYENVDTSKSSTITTLIKSDGSVVENYDISKLYEGVTTQEEIDARTASVAGSQIAIVNIEKEQEQMTLSTGSFTGNTERLLVSDHMAFGDLDAGRLGLFNMRDGLSIFCVNQ
jgi:hypothetical protein